MDQAGKPPPLASCIMPTANRRRFIPGAIAMFLAQDYPAKELIILDDGADPVADLIPPHPALRYLRTSPHPSLGAKRNAACAAARGEVILHWDDDDWYAPHRIRVQLEALLASGAEICGIDRAFFIDPAAAAAWEYVYPPRAAPWVCGAALCYRRSYWRTHPFPETNIGEDTRFVTSAQRNQVHVMPDNRFFVALIHEANSSPKHVHDPRWQPADFAALRTLTGRNWPALASPGQRILITAAAGIGDILRITPLIRAMHRLGHKVDVLIAPDTAEAAGLLQGAAEINALFTVDNPRAAIPAGAAQRIYDVATFTHWSMPLARGIQARRSLNFHHADWLAHGDSASIAAMAQSLGWQGAMPEPFAITSARKFAVPPGTIALHPGCKPGWPWKRWHGFAELARQCRDVVVVGTKSDAENAGTYFGKSFDWPVNVHDYTGQLDLRDTAALISHCAAMVANDSGLMHLAVALGVPTFGIFGITSPAREAIPSRNMLALTKGLPCEADCRRQPWGRRDCEAHLACLKTLAPDEVLAHITARLPALTAPVRAGEVQPMPSEKLLVAIQLEGGIGDVILASRLVEALFEALDHCQIDIIYHNPDVARFVFHGTPLVHHFHLTAARRPTHSYDVFVHGPHYTHFELRNRDKLRRLCPDAESLLQAAAERFAAYRGLFERRPHLDGFWGQLSADAGRNILDNCGHLTGLPINRYTPAPLCPDPAAYDGARAMLGLTGARYITLHDGFDNTTQTQPGQATKCWPIEHWTALAEQLHAALPGTKIVQLGGAKSRPIPGVDVNLLRRTSLHQAAWILKESLLHIDTDSGLVHLAQVLHTKSVVLFGPTAAALYGHDGNAVLRAGSCHECWWSTPDWLSQCPRGLRQPACMQDIAPADVAAQAMRMLDALPQPICSQLDSALYHGDLLHDDAEYLRDIFVRTGLPRVPVGAHAEDDASGLYLHASKQWEYLFVSAHIRAEQGTAQNMSLRILDVGGGRGALAAYLASLGHQVETIDPDYLVNRGDDAGIAHRYRRWASRHGLRARYGGLHNLPVARESQDVVTCISAIEHLHAQKIVLHELLRVLRPGGILLLTFDMACDPQRFHDGSRVDVLSPARLHDLLAPICPDGITFSATAVGESAAAIQHDGVCGIPAGMTVGGIALRKLPGCGLPVQTIPAHQAQPASVREHC